MEEFLAMGGYAKYVWGAFGASAVGLSLTLWLTKRQFKATRQRILRQVKSMEGKPS